VLRIPGVHDHRELFSAHSRHHTVLTDNLLNLPGKGRQYAITALVTVVIIDAFEVIDIQQHDG
jgi:hypothetical protein